MRRGMFRPSRRAAFCKREFLQAMATPTTELTLTFCRPFVSSAVDRQSPARRYRIVVKEEDIPDLSFLAFNRAATMLYIPTLSAPGATDQIFIVNADELAAAFEADRRHA